ncbi:hypothetical protein [Streptomyces olivoreticuli]|uniref:hypothetical protein n=1 Tax=Streptomyces olivoreticuli TaxID=68246 RepID=UPI0013C2FC56|nr:hypothetical protein [Streptomyces olivoreticuli]
MAQFVREMTPGVTVRELARRYPLSKTTWSQYRSGEKDIPWHWLERLVHGQPAAPRTRLALLGRARHLHERATQAAEGLRPPADERSAARQALDRARQAQWQAEASVAESEELIHVLLTIVAELRGELASGHPGGVVSAAVMTVDADRTSPRRARLQEATCCLAEVRRVRESAHVAQQAAHKEQETYRHLVDQEQRDHVGGDSRQGAELAIADGVQARLPALWRLEADLVGVRAALADQDQAVGRLAPSVLGPSDSRFVRGEVVQAPDKRLTSAMAPLEGVCISSPRDDGRRPGNRSRAARNGAVVAAAGVLVVAGVLVGVHLRTPAPAPGAAPPQAAGPYVSSAASALPGLSPSEPGASVVPSGSAGASLTSPSSPATPAVASVSPDASRSSWRDNTQGPSADAASQESPVVVPSPAGALYAVAPDHQAVYQWQGHGTDWTRIGGSVRTVLAGGAGLFAVRADDKQLLGYTGTPGKWTPVSEPGAEFAISGNHLYRLAEDRSAVYLWSGTGTSWTKIGGPAEHLYGGGAGIFASHPRDGRIYRYDHNTDFWSYIGNAGATFAVSGTHLYGLAPDRSEVFQWDGGASTSWTRIGGRATDLYAGPADLFATSPDHGTLLRYTRTPEFWSPVSEAGAEFAITTDHIYRLAPDHSAVYRASSNDTGTWTKIGGPAAALTASK